MFSLVEKIPTTAKAILMLAGAVVVGSAGTVIVVDLLAAPELAAANEATIDDHIESGGHVAFEEQVTQAMAQLSYRTARTENAMCTEAKLQDPQHYERYCIEVEIMRESGLVVPSGRRVDD